VRDSQYQGLDVAPEPLIYVSLDQYYFPGAVVYIHTAGNPEAVAAEVRRRMQALDRNLPLQSEGVRTTIRDTLWTQTLTATLLSGFGLLALAMASIGIYGVAAYSVEQRMREFGIRTALGATPWGLQRMILRQSAALVAVGAPAGMLISLAAARAIRGLLYGIGPADPVAFLAAPAMLGAVALAASWIPGLRAARISPARALREE
jgi:ABC-type antimicrobial peptide transport system permease subunit